MKDHTAHIHGNSAVILCDCMEYMDTLPDKHFDLAIVDPPYGIGADKPSKKPCIVKQKNGSLLHIKTNEYTHKDWDSSIPEKEYFKELMRVSKHQIVFGVNYYNYDCFGSGRIVWDKLNGESDQFGCEIAYCSLNNRTDMVYYMWAGMMQGSYCGMNIQKAIVQKGNKSLNEKRIHPTQKPVALYKWLLTNYAKPGDKILDTHGGSMSIAIACHDLGFELTVIEKDEDCYKAARQRLINHQMQQRLF